MSNQSSIKDYFINCSFFCFQKQKYMKREVLLDIRKKECVSSMNNIDMLVIYSDVVVHTKLQ